MRRFGRLQALWLSFYSRDLYREAARRWKGIGVLYLLLLLALTWLPSPVRWFAGLRLFAAGQGSEIVAQLPVITIEGGVMTADPPGPHVIPLDDVTLIIDDSVDTVPSDLDGQTAVLTRREFGMTKPRSNERRVWELGPELNMVIAPDDVAGFLGSLSYWVPPLGYFFCVAGSLIFRTLQVLLYGAIGLMLAGRWRAGLDYSALVRLSALAITPVVILRTLLWFGPWEPPGYVRWPVAVAIAMGYLVMGIKAAAGREAMAARAPVENIPGDLQQ